MATASVRSRNSVSSESAEVYITAADFTDQAGDGLSFKAGEHVEVISKNSSGWWYVQLNNEEGWVPSSYLDKVTQPIRKQGSLTRSSSHDQFNGNKTITSSKSEENLDQIGPANKFSSLEVHKRALTSENKLQLKGVKSLHMRSPDPARKPLFHNAVKQSRRSPPPVPAAFHKPETKKNSNGMPGSRLETGVTRSADTSLDKPHKVTASGDLTKVLKMKFESGNTAAMALPALSPRHKTVLQPNSDSHSAADKTVSPNKEKKVPPPRPKQGPQKKVGPGRPAISPALKQKLGTTSSGVTKQDHWITCGDYSETGDGCLSFVKGEEVEVIDSSNADWWYVSINGKEGYVPFTFLAKKEPSPVTETKPPVVKKRSTPQPVTKQPPKPAPRGGGKKRLYRALADYADEDGGLSFHEGDLLELLDDSDDWWFVKLGAVEGWAPSTYLEPA